MRGIHNAASIDRLTPVWRYGRRGVLVLDRPRIVAIINITPDSFFDASRATAVDASAMGSRAVDEGADALDIGGESTRPGAERVADEEQISRVVPVIRALRSRHASIPISIDTTRSAVARAAIHAGADAVNDVSAGTDDDSMLATCGELECGVILMHRRIRAAPESYSDQYTQAPEYGDVVHDVSTYLLERAGEAVRCGVASASIVIDPGLGFGKNVDQNLALIRGTAALTQLGFPVLSALSRKSFVGRVSLERDSTPAERLAGTLAMSVAHLMFGARLFRVHDVRAHVEALRAAWQVVPRS